MGDIVADVGDLFWKLELAAHAAQSHKLAGRRQSLIANAAQQLLASLLALGMLMWLALRHRGTPSAEAHRILSKTTTVFAAHGEDTTRTRHLRHALATSGAAPRTVLMLGRPSCSVGAAAKRFDPAATINGATFLRPLDLTSVIVSLPRAVAELLRGFAEVRRYRLPLPLRDRIAIAFRVALGIAHAQWWRSAAGGLEISCAIFAHTGNSDTSRLEQAMQAQGTRTIHVVHGTNIGWSFAGLSDLAVFQTGADARLGTGLPGYGRCIHLPIEKPEPACQTGDWALLTSYTHLQNSAYRENGAQADCDLVEWVRKAAILMGQDPKRIFWRPHPQIDLVATRERERLKAAIAQAGFSLWPQGLPYQAIGKFAVAVTTPSTALTDGLRLGQPVIVASVTPLQRDLLYSRYPLLAEDEAALAQLIARVLDPQHRERAFAEAWQAIEPGAPPDIARLLAINPV
ncbi:hypothetical protein [Parerythrobacter lacustris]|uniref:Uncharacterized protein n=1 Tax=Parerythrobacter lacustris TaxID=2969984 RepID=A0ABT1XRX4_9SPHN|nr:hypothetical protein [Parerythrobacter lacustris]MCR2834395.1 hypothetical protein [Parerythrobacter lacustris]